ncbi:MAG: peptidylprolyl isomerase [Candidatus Zixiibacteriota bacterium]
MKAVLTIMFLTAFFFGAAMADEQAGKSGQGTAPQKTETKYEKRKMDNPEIAIETDFGTMKLELFRDVAPKHVDSMLARIREGFYNGLIFHRIIDGFMIQGGDPKGNGTGNAGYYLPAEFSDIKHVEGTLSMARAQDPNSASCQFFICLAPAPHLNGQYTVFGHLMDGYEALRKIGKVKTGAANKPLEDVVIRKMLILKDIASKKEAGK